MMGMPQEILDRLVSIRVKIGRFGDDNWMTVERRDGFDGTRWAVCDNGVCLSRCGTWEYEPIPSSRTDAWKKRFRWETFAEAWEAAVKCEAAK